MLVGMILVFALGGCEREERQLSKGFRLPDGDEVVGKANFEAMQCNRCHTVEGVTLADRNLPALPKIHLGGEIYRVKSYGELVTSIINPDHIISPQYLKTLSEAEKERKIESPMLGFNEVMTVKQLTDIVAFLHARYRLIDPSTDEYFYVMP